MSGGRFAALSKVRQERDSNAPGGQAASASSDIDQQLERLRHENASLKRLIGRSGPQADPPAGPQHGTGAPSGAEATLRHENAALKRRMEMIQQQMDALKAQNSGGSGGGAAGVVVSARSVAGGDSASAAELAEEKLRASQEHARAEQEKARADSLERVGYTIQQERDREKGEFEAMKHENAALKNRLNNIDGKLREGASLQEQVAQLRKQLEEKDGQIRAANEKAREAGEGVKNLQDRVNQVTSQLHGKTKEAEGAGGQLSSLNEKLREANARIAEQVRDNERMRPYEERAKQLQTQLDEAKAKLSSQAQGHDTLLTEANTAKQEVSRLSRLCGEQNTKIGELEEQLGQMIAAGTSKDATLSNLASSRYQMHAELEGKTNELMNTKEEAQRYNMDLRETIAQLQVAQNRVKTLERRVREMDENMADLFAKESELMSKETELESLKLQLINQDEQERHSSQLSELLAEKETVLSEALKRQGQLIEEIEELEAEKKKYQREAERLKLQNDRNTATLREMQGSIEEQADAMAFSEKMLLLSREQTESLHAMRESLRDKEEVVAQKDAEIEAMASDHADETRELRERILGMTDANRLMQQQLVDAQSLGIERQQFEQLQRGYEDTRQQLAMSHNKNSRARDKIIRMRNMIVKRTIAQWDHATMQAAFSTWLNVAAGDQNNMNAPPGYGNGPVPPRRESLMVHQRGMGEYMVDDRAPSPPHSIALDALRPSRPWDAYENKSMTPLEQFPPPRNNDSMYRTAASGKSVGPTPPPPSWSQSMGDRPGAPEVLL